MTNLELASAMRNKLFADYGTDVDAAYQAASETINRLRPNDKLAVFVALHQLLNTVANHIEANEVADDDENLDIEIDDISHINEQEVTAYDPAEISAEWDGEDWNFSGALIKKHWGMSSTCFSPMELGYSYSKAARLTPDEAIAALMVWMDETLQHPQGEGK